MVNIVSIFTLINDFYIFLNGIHALFVLCDYKHLSIFFFIISVFNFYCVPIWQQLVLEIRRKKISTYLQGKAFFFLNVYECFSPPNLYLIKKIICSSLVIYLFGYLSSWRVNHFSLTFDNYSNFWYNVYKLILFNNFAAVQQWLNWTV